MRWRIEPLQGKYYGTIIKRDDGASINLWLSSYGDEDDREPSVREDIAWDDVCDNHYETRLTYQTAQVICAALNAVWGEG